MTKFLLIILILTFTFFAFGQNKSALVIKHGKKYGWENEDPFYELDSLTKTSAIKYYRKQTLYKKGNVKTHIIYIGGWQPFKTIQVYKRTLFKGDKISSFHYYKFSDGQYQKLTHRDINYYKPHKTNFGQSASHYGQTPYKHIFIGYHPNGAKQVEGQEKNGQKNGKWNYWNDTGNLDSTRVYSKGELIKTIKTKART